MPQLTNAVANDLVHIQATFDVAMDASSLLPHLWTCAPTGLGGKGAVVSCALSPAGTVADLVFSPRMSAGRQYALTAAVAKTAGGAALQPNDKTINFTVAAQATNPAVPGLPGGARAGFLQAIGEELQQLGGMPTTMIVADFPDAATTLLVESTLGFPASGRLWLDGWLYSYTSTTPASFAGVQPVLPLPPKMLTARELVVLDVSSVGALA